MKRIEYIAPIDYISGNISGRQSLVYTEQGDRAYDAPDGQVTTARNYEPRLIAKVAHCYTPRRIRYFQVRTRTSVNMTSGMRLSMAALGGAGALFGSLIRNKSAQIYEDCMTAKPKGYTLRQFVFPLLQAGLVQKVQHIVISDNIYIVNPWVTTETPNVPVSQAIIDKFEILGA